MNIKIVLFSLFFTSLCFAQTKVIAHKSHSGTNRSFSKAYRKKLFDMNRSNFGIGDVALIYVLDKVIAKNDSVVILQFRKSIDSYPVGVRYKDLKDTDFMLVSKTLINHKIFNRKNSVSFIKSSYAQFPYPFENPLDSIVFVGFNK